MTVIKSTSLADSVLAMVEHLSGDELLLYASPYENGREHGWALTSSGSSNKKVAFSQDGHSDRIVLYNGRMFDFVLGGNIPSGVAYENKNYFLKTSIFECANCIVEYFSKI